MSERIGILITDVIDKPIDIGTSGLQKLTFTGEFKEGEEIKKIRFQTFKKGLFDAIRDAKNKPNVEVGYDYEEKTSPGGDVFKNYKVSALYIDGKEIAGKKPYSGGGGRTPEERASIETQVAVKAMVELRIADKVDDNNTAYKRAMDWCLKRLAPPTTAKIEPETTAGKLAEKVGAEVAEETVEFNEAWWKDALEKTNFKGWLPETLKNMNIPLKGSYVSTLKNMTEGQRQIIVNDINQRLKEQTQELEPEDIPLET